MFIRSVVGVSLLLGALCASTVHAECAVPTPSAIPDGLTATEQEMLVAMKAFKQYDAATTAFLKCLDDETAEAIAKGAGDRRSLKEKHLEAHNATVDQLEAAASKFNKQVRIFK